MRLPGVRSNGHPGVDDGCEPEDGGPGGPGGDRPGRPGTIPAPHAAVLSSEGPERGSAGAGRGLLRDAGLRPEPEGAAPRGGAADPLSRRSRILAWIDRRLARLEHAGLLDDPDCIGVTIEVKLLPGKAEPKRVLTHPLFEDTHTGDGRPLEDDHTPTGAPPRRSTPGPSGPSRRTW